MPATTYPGQAYPGQTFPDGTLAFPPAPPPLTKAVLPPTLKFEVDFIHDWLTLPWKTMIPTLSPWAWFRLQEASGLTIADSSGNGRDGSLDVATNIAYHQAAAINEATDYALARTAATGGQLAVPHTGGGGGGYGTGFTAGLTWEFWMYPTALPASGSYAFVFGSDSAGAPVVILGSDGTVYVERSTFTPPSLYAHGMSAGLNQWTHVVMVVTGTQSTDTLYLYLNGALVEAAPDPTTNFPTFPTPIVNNISSTVHGFKGSSYGDFQGRLDEIVLYQQPLDAETIGQHYAAAAALYATSPTYVDLTSLVQGPGSVSRGRQRETDRTESGSFSVELLTTNRDLEPEYTGSPRYPNVVPQRQGHLTADPGTGPVELALGFVEAWDPDWFSIRRTRLRLNMPDLMSAMATWPVTGSFPAELTSARVNKILDKIGWSATKRRIDTGSQTVIAATLTRAGALEHLQLMAASENGLFYVDADGYAVFENGTHRATATRSTISQATFDEGNSAIPYLQLVGGGVDVQRVYNKIEVTVGSGNTLVVTDYVSRRRYGERLYSVTTALSTDAAGLALANALLAKLKDPHLRFDRMVLAPARDTRLWSLVLSLKISDRITAARIPPDIGVTVPLVKDCYIESLTHSFDAGGNIIENWRTTYALSPAA